MTIKIDRNSAESFSGGEICPQRPSSRLISVNISMTADGKAGLPRQKELVRIGSEADKIRMKELRLEADAVLVGSRTIHYDNTALRIPEENLYKSNGLIYPLRIAVVGQRLPSFQANIFDPELGGTTFIACGRETAREIENSFPPERVLICGDGRSVDPRLLINGLYDEYGVERILIEGGPTIIGLFRDADLIDRYHLTLCPYVFGGSGDDIQTPVGGLGVDRMEAGRFSLTGIESSGDWLFLTYDRRRDE